MLYYGPKIKLRGVLSQPVDSRPSNRYLDINMQTPQNDHNGDDPQNNGNSPFQFGNGRFKFNPFLIGILLLFLVPGILNFFMRDMGSNRISYSRFRAMVQEDAVSQVTVTGQTIQGMSDIGPFVTYYPSFGDQELMTLLENNNVVVETKPPQDYSFFTILLNLLPLFLIIWIGMRMFRGMNSQGRNIFSVGQNKAKLYEKSKQSVRFDDVAGLESAKEEIQEVVDYLKSPERYSSMGAKIPRGILLVGPPGTGKTLIARAIAGEADVPFYHISGSDFMEMFVGVGASRVRNLFADAKKNSPSIIFIDELDSVGRHRGAGLGGGHDEREQTLNQMLSELDGFEKNDSTIVLAATNRPDILDPALLRPGRFDRRITIGLPSMKDRLEILKIHADTKPLGDDIDFEKVAQGTPGFSGAELENLLNEAAILAARRREKKILMAMIEEARDKVMMGLERRNLTITPEEKRIIAYHEAGHAVTAAALPNTDPLVKVTVIPRDYAMGVTVQMPKEERYIYDKGYLSDRIKVLLGGRSAEMLMFGKESSGAANDLKEASKLARRMVTEWGMGETLGLLTANQDHTNVFLGEQLSQGKEFSEDTMREVDTEIRTLLTKAYNASNEILDKFRSALEQVAERLLEEEQISGDEVVRIVNEAAV